MGFGPTSKMGTSALVVTLVLVLGCGSNDDGENGNGSDNGADNGSNGSDNGDNGSDNGGNGGDGPDGGGTEDGDSPFCVSVGGECATTAECCGGRLCESDGAGVRRCVDETYCTGAGGDCSRASECCSLSCDGTCRDDGSLCLPSGTACDADSECCSNDCNGTCQSIGEHCAPMGETCDSEGFDADCCSKSCRNFGTDGDPDLRCERASSCGARGEICSEDADCCSGVCMDGRCPTQDQIGQKRFAGEPCQVDSDCASYLCASEFPGGPRVCQFLGGCRPTGEICTDDWQCCSDIHYTGPICPQGPPISGSGCVDHVAVPGLATCAGQISQIGPKEPGELCGDSEGQDVHDCCLGCEQTIMGVWRCAGEGVECPEGDDDCDPCVPDGDSCRSSADCCSNICSPFLVDESCDPTETSCETELRCGACVPSGGLCTTHADCCDFVCTDGRCGDPGDGDPVCIPIGGTGCDTHACCDDQAYCNDNVCSTVDLQ